MSKLEKWLGKSQRRSENINQRQAELMAITLNVKAPTEGEALPLCWHWAWFNDALPSSDLGRDGHPKRGGFLPPVNLPRRMWAGGHLEFLKPIIVGREITKLSTIEDIKHRTGTSGELCIVTIRHQLLDGEMLCVDERQNLVFREDPKNSDAPASLIEPPSDPEQSTIVNADPVTMFRYSALTFNGHRIHYDVDYARDVEGYPDLVFHAPLTASSLCGLACKMLQTKKLKTFSYRATAPLFCNQPIKLSGKKNEEGITLWAETPEGGQAMLATATH